MTWDHVSSKLGNIQPATRSIAQELYEAAADAGHEIWFMWGMGASSEHSTGRALDLMVRNKDAGDFLRNYVWENRKRLRLQHVIWWQTITSTVTRPGVVRKMSDRGNSTANHKDHPHVLVLPGAYQPPVKVEAPKTPVQVSTIVHRVQSAVDAYVDGMWGPKTDKRVILMRTASRVKAGWPVKANLYFDIEDAQRIIDTDVDGIWGALSQAALVAWVKEFQKILRVKSDGYWGPKTDGKLLSIRRRSLNNY